MASFQDFLMKSLEHSKSKIEAEIEEKLQEYVQNLPIQGHPFVSDVELEISESIKYKQQESSVYAVELSGSFSIDTVDPVDKDTVHISSGAFTAIYVFTHPGGPNYLEPEFDSIEIDDGRD